MCMYICMYAYVCMYVCMYVYVCVCVYVCMYVCMCVCVCLNGWMYGCMPYCDINALSTKLDHVSSPLIQKIENKNNTTTTINIYTHIVCVFPSIEQVPDKTEGGGGGLNYFRAHIHRRFKHARLGSRGSD